LRNSGFYSQQQENLMSEFAKRTHAKYEDDAVRFAWDEAGEPRKYEISADALQRFFGARDATGSELLEAFDRGQGRIIRAVERSLNTPTDGVTELGSGDFEGDDDGTGNDTDPSPT
ncbi:MAG TPA: DUF1488 family protein, partial [Castellaniella sp.]|nr:DUF1488 family protein [Castellaniella sp.]